MPKLTAMISCGLCPEQFEAIIEMPEGWAHRYEGIDDEHDAFCPKHAPVSEFAEAQCAGCVGGWGDCDMWSAFAYSGSRRSITDADLESIECGICPYRTNGTFAVDGGTVTDINLSDRASPEAGKSFAQAIREYIEAYP